MASKVTASVQASLSAPSARPVRVSAPGWIASLLNERTPSAMVMAFGPLTAHPVELAAPGICAEMS